MVRICVDVPVNGDQEVILPLKACRCGCEKLFEPKRRGELFFSRAHRTWYNNNRRRKFPLKRSPFADQPDAPGV